MKEAKKKSHCQEKKIWIDLENSPHVPFFKPIIYELEQRGFKVLITTRDAYQTRDLADFHKLTHKCIGKHSGKFKLLKIGGILLRVLQLIHYVRKFKPVLAISHGSRSQLIAARLTNIKSVFIFDYEYTMKIPFIKPSYQIIPALLNGLKFQNAIPTFKYSGIKEDVYIPFFKPQTNLSEQLHFPEEKIIVTIRPPATEAHYHVAESEDLFLKTIDFLKSKNDVVIILLPRSSKQHDLIEHKWAEAIKELHIIMPDKVLDGLELIWASDVVISGGGTMNREAAALGVPVYSIFRGQIGAVDAYLNKQGRLFFIKDLWDIKKINFVKRNRSLPSDLRSTVLDEIVAYILQCI